MQWTWLQKTTYAFTHNFKKLGLTKNVSTCFRMEDAPITIISHISSFWMFN